jgi:putative flippase GtrA
VSASGRDGRTRQPKEEAFRFLFVGGLATAVSLIGFMRSFTEP